MGNLMAMAQRGWYNFPAAEDLVLRDLSHMEPIGRKKTLLQRTGAKLCCHVDVACRLCRHASILISAPVEIREANACQIPGWKIFNISFN